jgi:hypothetical protein
MTEHLSVTGLHAPADSCGVVGELRHLPGDQLGNRSGDAILVVGIDDPSVNS